MLKDPPGSWLSAGLRFWLGYAAPILLAGAVRMAVVETPAKVYAAVGYVTASWGAGMVGALAFGLILLLLGAVRPCRPESAGASAALGALTGCLIIAAGVDWDASPNSTTWLLLSAFVSGVLVHAFTPGLPRRIAGPRRARRPVPPIGVFDGCGLFLGSFTVILSLWFVCYGWGESIPMDARFVALPAVAMTASIFGFVVAATFGLGAAAATLLRGERILRPWYCSASACGQALLLAVLAWSGESVGFYLTEPTWILFVPFLTGIASAFLPKARVPA